MKTEVTSKLNRSKLWNNIYKEVKQLPRKDVDGDAVDYPSLTTTLEELFLKEYSDHQTTLLQEQFEDLKRQNLELQEKVAAKEKELGEVNENTINEVFLRFYDDGTGKPLDFILKHEAKIKQMMSFLTKLINTPK